MSRCLFYRRLAREWLVALSSYALLVAPFGCQIVDLTGGGTDTDDVTTQTAGLFVNSDYTSSLMVAGRSATDDAFFVYGTRQSDGGIRDVQSILVRTADGQESFIIFELGRPVYAQGPDRSHVRIQYNEVSAERLRATAEVFDAAGGTAETFQVDVDLRQTAAQVAEAVRGLTGQTLSVPQAPAQTAKDLQSALRITVSSPLFGLAVAPLLYSVSYSIIVLGQVMSSMLVAASVVAKAAIVVAFWPLFAVAALLDDVLVRIDLQPLVRIFVNLPSRPTIPAE